ncbi:Os09g0331201 [Oryza sativa Japonica Group]|jgi:hypothetical protein|uniref:Os09g0331201 protein n=2 Tax=Oryza sativa subsp. japonica TaxID=39947 RepID=B9G2Z3_ORYSJ|nr:hypothetical protein OsJ_28917 [Oryza sativa Japonica Group]BAT07522.1 Os09g0331201 [Oryza sativa Japonica Group]
MGLHDGTDWAGLTRFPIHSRQRSKVNRRMAARRRKMYTESRDGEHDEQLGFGTWESLAAGGEAPKAAAVDSGRAINGRRQRPNWWRRGLGKDVGMCCTVRRRERLEVGRATLVATRDSGRRATADGGDWNLGVLAPATIGRRGGVKWGRGEMADSKAATDQWIEGRGWGISAGRSEDGGGRERRRRLGCPR